MVASFCDRQGACDGPLWTVRSLIDNTLKESHEQTVRDLQALFEPMVARGVVAELPLGNYAAVLGFDWRARARFGRKFPIAGIKVHIPNLPIEPQLEVKLEIATEIQHHTSW